MIIESKFDDVSSERTKIFLRRNAATKDIEEERLNLRNRYTHSFKIQLIIQSTFDATTEEPNLVRLGHNC